MRTMESSTENNHRQRGLCPRSQRLLLLPAATSPEAALTGASLQALSVLAGPFPWLAPPPTSPYHAKQKELDAFFSSRLTQPNGHRRQRGAGAPPGFPCFSCPNRCAQTFPEPELKITPRTLLLQPHALSTNNPGKRLLLRSFPAPAAAPWPRGAPREPCPGAGSAAGPARSRPAGHGPSTNRADPAAERDGGAHTAPRPEPLVTAAVRSAAAPGAEGRCPAEPPHLGPRSRRSDRYRSRPPSAAPAAAPCCGRSPSPPVPGTEAAGGSAQAANEEPERPGRPRPLPCPRAPPPAGGSGCAAPPARPAP